MEHVINHAPPYQSAEYDIVMHISRVSIMLTRRSNTGGVTDNRDSSVKFLWAIYYFVTQFLDTRRCRVNFTLHNNLPRDPRIVH